MEKYQPANFEEKWVEIWEKEEVYKTLKPTDKKKKQYILAMFPYPSGDGLHVGHVRIYTGTDVLARYFRMNGYQVLHPMGWDAFGLPAENRAIKEKKNPMDLVPKNIANFKRQMKRLGFSYDWEREFSTTDPSYYKWTQWLFIQFFKMGLLAKREMPVYYCPSCKTGLAEEEVLPDGTHERCQKPITRKTLPQWVFKITQYADQLLEDLKCLDWPEGILEMQRNWIGKSEGVEIEFSIFNFQFPKKIKVFTTRADTLFGVTAIVVAPEHWLIDEILKIKNQRSKVLLKIEDKKLNEIEKYVKTAKRKLDLARTDLTKEKTGVFTGFYALHPLTNEKIPIFVADYVLGWYGEGAVMVVPAHDDRDFEFAKKFNLPIKIVIIKDDKSKIQEEKLKKAFTDEGVLINSGEFNGLTSKKAIKKITEKLEKLGLGRKAVSYKLRDWIFSRQRYWGEPIPLVYCQKCGWVPLKDEDLPLKLPYLKSYEPTVTGESPLSKIKDWVNTTCPSCGGEAKRETDTMPNWAGSCWYFLAFAFWRKNRQMENFPVNEKISSSNLLKDWQINREKIDDWLPVDWYLGGAEHAVLHLLYARFWVKALYTLKLLSFKEPFLRLRNVGMVLAEDHRKMSKSFGNVINPDEVVQEYGADTLRLYEMFMAPFNQEIAWSTKALQGCYRFLRRVKEMYDTYKEKQESLNEDKQLVVKLKKTIKKVALDIETTKFNTAIAAMMEFMNAWEASVQTQNAKHKTINRLSTENAKKFLQILAPFAPFLTEEIWREVFGERQSIHLSTFPQVKGEIQEEEIVIPVQINGKTRATIKVKHEILKLKQEIEKTALENEKVKKYLRGRKYKMIYVEGKIINFVYNHNQ